MASDHPEILAAAAYSEALQRHTPLLTAFERFLRVADELVQRCEREMYAGPGYGSGKNAAGAPTKGFIDPKLAQTIVAVGRALSQAGAVHARLLQDENARADRMSAADKMKFMTAAIKRYAPSDIREHIAELQACL